MNEVLGLAISQAQPSNHTSIFKARPREGQEVAKAIEP